MFDVTPDEIVLLNDRDLRELVGRLCEAELASKGLSPAAVTWGGNQTAADGGLDVRVTLPEGTPTDGFIPRPSTGFQVKTPDMARAAIVAEMRPSGYLRPAIQELAEAAGCYIIVSSSGSTADSALRNRRDAMREALEDVVSFRHLQTDFFDRTRLATWVRCHPGLITWVKERIGHALVGWRPYDAWSSASERIEADYLLDHKLRLHLGKQRGAAAKPVIQAIDELRGELSQPGKMVRLVGLSGVGKTRVAQALFDARIGSNALPTSLAVYTNLSDNPNPQPTGLASDLIANRTRAVLIVDNCPSDLHRRLSDLCTASDSTVSVLTVEYDVRDDQPEGTHVVTLDTSSPELIGKLITRRYPHLSQVDARTIAETSGGNARIALALAETVKRTETIAGLSDDELFQRLFRQRHDPDNGLLLAAQACSLVYSFQGDAPTGVEAELPRLALLAEQSAQEFYRHVGELIRRDLVQKRSVWRAVLPHAIANRLAIRALEDTPYELIDQQLVTCGTERLAQSFSRRLSFLHEHALAVAIVERWLAPGGLLSDVAALDHIGRAMFENVAPVSPKSALTALERAGSGDPQVATRVWHRHRSLLRSLAYDRPLFERSASMLARASTQIADDRAGKEASDTFVSLFTIYLSGTHATIEQRLAIVEELLRSGQAESSMLGLAALDQVLKTAYFGSSHCFEFGARSRDYGYQPGSDADVRRWYAAALVLIERLLAQEGLLKPELRDLVARNYRGLWASAHMYAEMEALTRRLARDGFWREGWAACRQTMRFDGDRLQSDGCSRLAALEVELRPSNLVEKVRAVALGDVSGWLVLEDVGLDGDIPTDGRRVDAIAYELGAAVAVDQAVFAELLPDLLRKGASGYAFGRGLAGASEEPHATWGELVECLGRLTPEERNVQVLIGYLAELWIQDQDTAQDLLDAALDQSALMAFVPALHTAVQLDSRGVERLKRALNSRQAPIWTYRSLIGHTTDHLEGGDLKTLLLHIAERPAGWEVAVHILYMRLCSDHAAKRQYAPELLDVGRDLLRQIRFSKGSQRDGHNLAGVARACLTGPEGVPIAAEVARRLRQAAAAYETHGFENHELLTALLTSQSAAVLSAIFQGDPREQREGADLFYGLQGHRSNPMDEVSCGEIIAWCDQDRNTRYPLTASIVTLARGGEASQPQVWSDQAKALLIHGPDPSSILAIFVERFRPMSWSGSRAALIEANARLLDRVGDQISTSLVLIAAKFKAAIAQDVIRERQWELEHDRERDERFE